MKKTKIFELIVSSLVPLLFLLILPSGCKKTSPTGPDNVTNPAPTPTSISPTSGSTAGGTSVTITGTNFSSGATVTFGGTSATGANVTSSTSITATTPAHSAGMVNVVVANSDGQSGQLSNGFTYVAANYDVNGSWEGATASGAKFTFSVTDMEVRIMTLSKIPDCGSNVFGWTMNCDVVGNSFNYTAPSAMPDLSGTINGTFSSDTSASGNMNVTFKTGCKGKILNSTWTATKK
jgi:hypothetical protein